MKKVLFKIIKIFVCILFSAVLVLGIVAVPFYYSITALTKPETVSMVIQEVDYKQIIQKNPAIQNTLAKYAITPENADTIMKSKQAGEIVEIYADEVIQIFLDIPDDKKIDVPYLKELVENNTDKFLDIAEENTNLKFEREKAQPTIDAFFENNEILIEESVATIEEVKDVVKIIYTSRVVEKQLSFQNAVVIIALAFIVIGIIIAFMHSNGFLLISGDFFLGTVLICLILAFGESKLISDFAWKISDFGTQIVESAISISVEKMTIAAFCSAIMMILFMVFFVALKLLKYKYQTRREET